MMFLITIFLVISTLLLWWYKNACQGPPGPIGVPILGYLPFLGSKPLKTLQNLSEKYGSIIKLNLLNRDFYFLNSIEVIEEAFGNQGDNFAGRPVDEFNIVSFIYQKSLPATEGEDWKIQQKFFINKLSGFGMGKTDFGYKLHEICDDLIENIKEEKELNNLNLFLSNYTSNVISTLMYNKRYKPNDPIYKQLNENIDILMGSGNQLYFYLTGPLTELSFKINRKVWNNFKVSLNGLIDFMYNRMKERIEKGETQEFNDILDYCIQEMKGPNSELFNAKTIVRNYLGLLIAGADTTSSTLHFAIYFMASNPEVQNRVFNEIVDVFGKDYQILFTEMEKLNYTRAVIAEIQRVACVVPLGLLHVNREAATIDGYRFPKRSMFIPNIYNVSRDKRHFKNPDVFDPNNFLDENGNYTPNKAHIPFGVGKRKCLGYKLAEMELDVAFTRLIQEFEWLPPKDGEINFELKANSVRYISPYNIVAKLRI